MSEGHGTGAGRTIIYRGDDPQEYILQLERALTAERERANRIARSAWVSAIVLAHNICVQENDSINSNDGSVEAMDALSEAARRIREWAEPTDEQISQLLAESVGATTARARMRDRKGLKSTRFDSSLHQDYIRRG